MRLVEFKQFLREQVLLEQHSQLRESITSSVQNFKNLHLVQEHILSGMIALFLEPKVRKQAEALKNSPEYKELMHQMKQSTDSLNALTTRLKKEVDKYNTNLKSMQKAGVKVKPGMDIKQMAKEVEKWRADRARKFKAAHKEKMVTINPDWGKYLQ